MAMHTQLEKEWLKTHLILKTMNLDHLPLSSPSKIDYPKIKFLQKITPPLQQGTCSQPWVSHP
jgi:hypothetical protein